MKKINDIYRLIGSRMRERREELKLSRKEVALKCNIAEAYYAQLENASKTPSLQLVIAIAETLQVQICYLVSSSKDEATLCEIQKMLDQFQAKERQSVLDLLKQTLNSIQRIEQEKMQEKNPPPAPIEPSGQ